MDFLSKNEGKLEEYLRKITGFMNLDCRFELREEDSGPRPGVLISIYTQENVNFLIGRNGQNLNALEHLIRFMLFKNSAEPGLVSVDINDYRKSRASRVIDLARKVVMRVRNTQKAEALLPMPSQERRIIHMELASYPDIATESIGDGPNRRIVVKPYP